MNVEDIKTFNSHWKIGELIPSRYKFKRKLFKQISRQLALRFIVSIEGLRRTGKSVLMQQIIDYLVTENQIPASSVLMFSFDLEDDRDLLPPSELKELLHIYFTDIIRKHPKEISSKVIISLDEIQNVANWQSVLKPYYDLNENIKFILTGSSTLFLKESSDSLAGRIIEYSLPCLDFEEFLQLIDNPINVPFAQTFENLFSILPFPVNSQELDLFETFLLIGGFPDAAIMFKQGLSIEEIQSFIRNSIINKVIKKDLKKYFNVKNTHIDSRLYDICMNESGGFVELNKLAQETGLSSMSVRAHLDIFQQSKLLQDLKKYDRKLRRELKSSRKYYASSPSLMYSMLYKKTTEDSSFRGHAAETYAHQKLRLYAEQIYVETGRNNLEKIDFYLPHQNTLIECKYANRYNEKEFAYLNRRANELGSKQLILTKTEFAHKGSPRLPLFLL